MKGIEKSDIWKRLSKEQQDAFINDTAHELRLPAGTILCRFNATEKIEARDGFVSPWWIPIGKMDGADPHNPVLGLKDLVKTASILGTGMEYVRNRLAISEPWNSLENVSVVRLTQDKTVVQGEASSQFKASGKDSKKPASETSGPSSNLVGRWYQFYIPNLKLDQLTPIVSIQVRSDLEGLKAEVNDVIKNPRDATHNSSSSSGGHLRLDTPKTAEGAGLSSSTTPTGGQSHSPVNHPKTHDKDPKPDGIDPVKDHDGAIK